MLVDDYASLEAAVDKADPSWLLIEIRLHPGFARGVGSYEPVDVQRAVREALAQAELERLVKASSAPKARRGWLGRIAAFTLSAAIGAVATLLLSASHAPRLPAVGSLTPPLLGAPAGEASLAEAPGPQSHALPDPARAAASAAPRPGPATFGLREQ